MTFKERVLSSLVAGSLIINSAPLALAAENEVSQSSGGKGQSSITLTVEDTHSSGGSSGGGSSGGGSSSSSRNKSYTISIEKTEGVETDPSGDVSVKRNNSLTVKIKAKEGYIIKDVLVDGKSQGVIDSYTFKYVAEKHIIKIIAEPISMLTDDHIAYIKGYKDGGVHPEENITRAEVSAIFYRLMREDKRKAYDKDNADFKDTDDTWAKKEIATLEKAGILNGYKDGTFCPSAPITRAEFVTIASRFDTIEEGNKKLKDVESSHWAYKYIISALQKGWIEGYGDGTFRPDNNITRAEAVKITNALLDRECDKEYINAHDSDITKFNDISDKHWAYQDIIEASNAHDYKRENNVEKWSNKKAD